MLEERMTTRERFFRDGEKIVRRLKAISSLEERTKKPDLFREQKEELQKKIQELRKGL